MRQALWAVQPTMQENSYPSGYNGDECAAAPELEGSVPLHYRASLPCRQWQAVLTRTLAMEPSASPLPFDIALMNQALRTKTLPEPLRVAGLSCTVYSSGEERLIPSPSGDNAPPQSNHRISLSRETIHSLCVAPNAGIFALVTQLSPLGNSTLDDLVFASETGDSQSLCVVLARDGEDFVMYRRFAHER